MSRISQQEINDILMEKTVSDLYMVVAEKRDSSFSPSELFSILARMKVEGKLDDLLDRAYELIERYEETNGIELNDDDRQNLLMISLQYILGNANVRHTSILTEVDNRIFDLSENDFFDIGKEKIVAYENMSTVYDEDSVRMLLIPDPLSDTGMSPMVELDNYDILKSFLQLNSEIEEDTDETYSFISEVLGNSKTKKR